MANSPEIEAALDRIALALAKLLLQTTSSITVALTALTNSGVDCGVRRVGALGISFTLPTSICERITRELTACQGGEEGRASFHFGFVEGNDPGWSTLTLKFGPP